ncbi:MAG TPA: peptidylprolyl isomerase [Mycobacteriales bacterium]|nr:peptidylprolyl isomerase [Mycobacteriales bacterium]
MIRRNLSGSLAGSRRRRSLGLVAGAALIALAASGCKSVVHAGAAATIGDHRISVADLRTATDDLYAGPGALSFTRAQVQQYVLNAKIRDVLFDRVAADLGVSPPPDSIVREQVAELEQQLGGEAALIARGAQIQPPDGPVLLSHATIDGYFRQYLEQQAITAALVRKMPPSDDVLQAQYQQDIANYQSEDSDFILVKTEALAAQIKGQLDADPSKFAALAKQYSTDASTKVNGGAAGNQPRGSFPTDLEDPIFAAKDGDIIGPLKTQLGYFVVKINKITNIPFARAKADILQKIESGEDPAYGTILLAHEVAQISKTLDVHVNARFGSWSAKTASVGADLSALSTPAQTGPTTPADSSAPSGTTTTP